MSKKIIVVIFLGLIYMQPELVFPDTIPLTVTDSIYQALNNNPNVETQRLNMNIADENIIQSKSAFDASTTLGYDASHTKTKYTETNTKTNLTSQSTNASISKNLKNGQEVELGASYSDNSTDVYSFNFDWSIPIGAGSGREYALIDVKLAENSAASSKYDYKNYLIDLVADIESEYWDAVQKKNILSIRKESLELSQEQKKETEIRIKIGKTAAIELAAALADESQRKEDLINAKSDYETTKLNFIKLISSPATVQFDNEIEWLDKPFADTSTPKLEYFIKKSFESRPDILQTEIDIKSSNLNIVKTKNGLLPDINFVLGADYDNKDIPTASNQDVYTFTGGVSYTFPWGDRSDKSKYRSALADKRQSKLALANLKQIVELDVRQAVIEVNRTKQQLEATRNTEKYQKEKLRNEREKFRVGRSTNILVFQAQRDYTEAEVSAVTAVIANKKAWIDLYKKSGLLLEWQGIKY